MPRFLARFQPRQSEPRPVQFRHSRHTVRIPCQLVRDKDFKLIADSLLDVSASGVLAVTSEEVLTGERVWVSFRLPNTDTWVDTMGTVARVVHGRRPGEHARALGIELDELRPWLGFLFKRLVDSFPAVPPSCRPGRRKTWQATLALVAGSGRPTGTSRGVANAA